MWSIDKATPGFFCTDLVSLSEDNVLAVEGVQQRITRLIPGMAGLSYEERLSRLGLHSIEMCRVTGDLMETYKILPGLDMVDAERMFPIVGESKTTGWHCGTAASQRQGPGFNSWLGSLSVWSLHILPVSALASSGYSGFLSQSERLAG